MIRRGPVTNRMSLGRVLSIAVAVLLLVTPSRAYYQYIHYAGRTAPFAPIYEKYDLYSGGPTMLPNKTVTFFVSDQSPTTYGPNDSFPAVLSQVKQAIAEWNAVTSSDLRVAFGGVESSPRRRPSRRVATWSSSICHPDYWEWAASRYPPPR